MPATSPYEILSGPISAYVAPVGTAFADVSQAPAGTWVLLGTSGDKNYLEDGVTIRHIQTVETDAFRMLGTTGPRKAARTSEDLEIELMLADLKMAQVAMALNGLAHLVTATAAGALQGGNKNIPLLRGTTVGYMALMLRGVAQSSEAAAIADTFNAQWDVPIVTIVGEPEEVWNKSAPVALQVVFRAIDDATLGFGTMRMQDAVPSA